MMPNIDDATIAKARKRGPGRPAPREESPSDGETLQKHSTIFGGKPDAGTVKHKQKSMDKNKTLDRNIDNVHLGLIKFKTWYPSWYPAPIIGEKALAGESKGIVVEDLYVCPKCFKYSKVDSIFAKHLLDCKKEVPGQNIYTHDDTGVWSIWEVDGENETLFCQNLSLFAKLFLDNKSVFFDVSAFNYFLLVHTDPTNPSQPHIVGFFSKEKRSWDNNNLACILIFPPWQKKSLGTILMGVSYAISRRQGILGGPEKPISELGRRGYRRYWAAEIARFLLSVKEKTNLTLNDVSQGTWIVPDDCLSVLREMDVAEKINTKGKQSEQRVKLDKEKIRAWVDENKISLSRVVNEDGLLEGYGYPSTNDAGDLVDDGTD